jgi:ubiquinone/menaquinone biosynthesis C-methylase UbiE
MGQSILSKKWDSAADLIDRDAMRPVRYAMAMRYLKHLRRNVRILDVGCGEGGGLAYLLKKGYTNLSGAEISNERAKRANKKLPERINIKLINKDSKLKYRNGYFDVVMSLAVIEHVNDVDIFLSELKRVLKPEGILIISSDCYTWRILEFLHLHRSVQPIDKTFNPFQFQYLFNGHNLSILHADTFNLPDRGNLYWNEFKMINNFLWGKKQEAYEYKEYDNIVNQPVNYSFVGRLGGIFLQYFRDENIFLLKLNRYD